MLLEKQAWREVGGFDQKLDPSEDFAFARQLATSSAVKLGFTAAAKVTWIPPQMTLVTFAKMIASFAQGDIKAGILRPKVIAIFGRYLCMVVVSLWLMLWSIEAAVVLWLLFLVIYSGWAISKNLRYVPHGWYWLPILQITADVVVMWGSGKMLLAKAIR